MASTIKLTNENGKVTTISSGSSTTDITVDGSKLLAQTDTIATLKAMVETPGTIYVTGYTTADDGAFGSHFFKWNSASTDADNGGTIIKLTGTTTGRYELQYSGAMYVKWFGAVGNGTTNDSSAVALAIAALTTGAKLIFNESTAYLLSSTLEVFNKPRTSIDFNKQLIYANGAVGIHFKGMSQSVIDNIFVIGNGTNTGVDFDADVSNITIHCEIGKVHVSNCNIAVKVGSDAGHQFSDSSFQEIYGADSNIGVYLTGENTLAMLYHKVAAYNNVHKGVFFEQGGGTITSLQVAASGDDLFFGSTTGLNQSKLNRWDILGGYSEEGVAGEVFINSVACADTNPFVEQIVISGFRCTPFTSTNVIDFLKWNLNGDLIVNNSTFGYGTQYPELKVDANMIYRLPEVKFNDCVFNTNPVGAADLPLTFNVTNYKAKIHINSVFANSVSFWNNGGAANEGTITKGFYTQKILDFTDYITSISGAMGVYNLLDVTSSVCKNAITGKADLAASATLERRDMVFDDGLLGIYKNGASTTKTLSNLSADFALGSYTFGCILRTPITGIDETSATVIGGNLRLGLGDTAGAFARFQAGAFNVQATVSNPLDPHLVIGRYDAGVDVIVDAINLRTGETVQAKVGSAPALVDLTWVDGISIRNEGSVRGFTFAADRVLSDIEVSGILTRSLVLTSTWR